MLSACDSSSTPTDSRVTARYSRSTQVHPGPSGSPIPLLKGGEALQSAILELQQLTEATASSGLHAQAPREKRAHWSADVTLVCGSYTSYPSYTTLRAASYIHRIRATPRIRAAYEPYTSLVCAPVYLPTWG